jgi:hypothetical protein
MPQFLPRLATLKINEASGFLRHEITCLKREGDNGHFFHAFQFPASLARDLSKGIYSFGGDTHTLRTEWHKGLGPGIAMTRNWEEVAATNSSLASLDEYGYPTFTWVELTLPDCKPRCHSPHKTIKVSSFPHPICLSSLPLAHSQLQLVCHSGSCAYCYSKHQQTDAESY